MSLKPLSPNVTGRGDSALRRAFIGPSGLRAGWRLALYAAIFLALFALNDLLRATVLRRAGDLTRYGIVEVLSFFDLLAASFVMARIERRRVGDYGLPWSSGLGSRGLRGAGIGLAWISLVLFGMRLTGAFHIEGLALRGGDIAINASLYALFCLTIGFKEEFYYRGYTLFTLATGIGFWPAAALSSAFFGVQHHFFAQVSWFGALNIALGGLLFCLVVRRTGDLWMVVGLHAAIDWAEAFLYGVPVSGHTLPGVLVNSHLSGPAWLAGGSVGPEGSVLFTVSLVVLWVVVSRWLRVPGNGERRAFRAIRTQ